MLVEGNRVFVRAGEIAVADRGMVLMTVGLGSCIAVAIDDPTSTIGGLAHIFLPEPPTRYLEELSARYVTTAIPQLVERVLAAGAQRSRLRARLAGGAMMFPELLAQGATGLGARNIAAAREQLELARIPIAGESVGGSRARSVFLHLADGRLVVRSAGQPDLIL